jgi:hypothetical protein
MEKVHPKVVFVNFFPILLFSYLKALHYLSFFFLYAYSNYYVVNGEDGWLQEIAL